VQTGLRIAAALGGYWRYRARLQEGQSWLRRALDFVDQAPDSVQGRLYFWAGFFALHDPAEAKHLFEKALAIERRQNNQSEVAEILIHMGWVMTELSDHGLEFTKEGISLAREIDDRNGMAHGLNVLGEIHRLRADFVAARKCYEESLSLTREIGNQLRETMVMANLGMVAFYLGDFKQARQRQLETYRLALEIGDESTIAGGIAFNGGYLGALGQPERAVRLLAAGDSQMAALGSRQQPVDQVLVDRLIAMVREKLDDDTFDRLWAEGEAMSLEDTIDLIFRED